MSDGVHQPVRPLPRHYGQPERHVERRVIMYIEYDKLSGQGEAAGGELPAAKNVIPGRRSREKLKNTTMSELGRQVKS